MTKFNSIILRKNLSIYIYPGLAFIIAGYIHAGQMQGRVRSSGVAYFAQRNEDR